MCVAKPEGYYAHNTFLYVTQYHSLKPPFRSNKAATPFFNAFPRSVFQMTPLHQSLLMINKRYATFSDSVIA